HHCRASRNFHHWRSRFAHRCKGSGRSRSCTGSNANGTLCCKEDSEQNQKKARNETVHLQRQRKSRYNRTCCRSCDARQIANLRIACLARMAAHPYLLPDRISQSINRPDSMGLGLYRYANERALDHFLRKRSTHTESNPFYTSEVIFHFEIKY